MAEWRQRGISVDSNLDLFAPARHEPMSRLGSLLILYLSWLPAAAWALQFHPNPSTGEIVATGVVESEDADRIAKILTLEYRQDHHRVRDLVTVSLNSPGGSLLGGLRLGYALRELGVHTHVGPGQSCMSACALAFLGGRKRTVEGRYGVHAASLQDKAAQSATSLQLDTVQKLSAITTAYSSEMTGRSDVALRALSTSASQISVLDDAELVSMAIITVARRPSQFGRTGFRCPTTHDIPVLSAICVHLDIAQLDQELNTLFSDIRREGAPPGLAEEQERWRRYRNSCIYADSPNGYDGVVQCVRAAYTIRRDQLKSHWLAITSRKSGPAAENWRPLTPVQ